MRNGFQANDNKVFVFDTLMSENAHLGQCHNRGKVQPQDPPAPLGRNPITRLRRATDSIHAHDKSLHSVRNASTGFAQAARMAWALTVSNTTASINIPPNANVPIPGSIRYAKSCNHHFDA